MKTVESDKTIIRRKIIINGIVQGVGFRPFIYRIAQKYNLTGFINNNSHGVFIEVQGSIESIEKFSVLIKNEAPPLSKITQIKNTEITPVKEKDFLIIETKQNSEASTFISPDVCVCKDCLQELKDPANKRYNYPFINCTNCGPRYTIVKRIPYDRPFTSMNVFPLCPSCQKEYNDPKDRRFHAQPNACAECGPKLTLVDNQGLKISTDDPLIKTVELIKKGKIIAIRGLGGFHLAVDAFNKESLNELRGRKGRQGKPFALLANSIESINKYCVLSKREIEALQHHTRPIVLLESKKVSSFSDLIAPGNKHLGFMLPYTPLHYLLMENFEALVMTSANFTDEPIAINNDEAIERLNKIADYFLLHDREILQRCDDSILRVVQDKNRIIRRSRGYVPGPLFLKDQTHTNILAVGGELKNTIAISRGNTVFFSQHIGDLDNPAAYNFFQNSIEHLQDILQLKPALIACDKHPEYLSTKWAKDQDIPIIEVQHHHAHLAAVMVENNISSQTIGLILDGTGFGRDGTIWGGEVLIGDFAQFERFAWLEPIPMPGGAAAIKQPWRMALSYLFKTYGEDVFTLDLPVNTEISNSNITLIKKMIDKNLNSPLTSSCGRLFDAVSAILGICLEITFEAEAAIQLEMSIDSKIDAVYDVYLNNTGSMSMDSLIKMIVEDFKNGLAVPKISAKFHNTFAKILVNSAEQAREISQINRVALSGGVYQNVYLFNKMVDILKKKDFDVITHSQIPTNDGGLALGQIAVANELSKS